MTENDFINLELYSFIFYNVANKAIEWSHLNEFLLKMTIRNKQCNLN